MDARFRHAPAALLAALLVTRAFQPGFLGQEVAPGWVVSWFWVAFTALLAASSLLLAPQVVRIVTKTAKNPLLRASLLLALVVGTIWTWDTSWNYLVVPFCDACPESHFLSSLTTAMFGGMP